MTPRSVRYLDEAKRKFALAAFLMMTSAACGAFAFAAYLGHQEWPMTLLGLAACALWYGSTVLGGKALDRLKASRREAYWEHRRIAERFIETERI